MKLSFFKNSDFWVYGTIGAIFFALFAIHPVLDFIYGDKGKIGADQIDSVTTKTVLCHNGFQYLIVTTGWGAGLTQIFENGPNGLRAVECPRVN